MEVYEPRLSEYFFNFDVDNHELIWSRPEKVVQKYYLKDEFIGRYLNHIISEGDFYFLSKEQLPDYQTQFTMMRLKIRYSSRKICENTCRRLNKWTLSDINYHLGSILNGYKKVTNCNNYVKLVTK